MPTAPEPARCQDHGLVIAADGRCVLCRRGSPGRSWKGTAIAATTLLAATTAGLLITRQPSATAILPAPQAVAGDDVPLARPADEAGADELEARRQLAVQQHQRLVVEEGRRDEAERQARARALAAAEEQRLLRDAMRDVSITMYTTAWCPVCTQARDFLASNGFRFVDRDVEADAAARTVQRRLNPKGSVPTIDIEGQILVGFAPRSLLVAIETAARRRRSAEVNGRR